MSDPWALARYQAIAAYVALVPPRGKRRVFLEQLALHTLIQGAVLGVDTVTTDFMTQQLHNHPLFDPATGA